MSSRTKIEWTRADDGSAGQTWNPITGCTKVSPGCEHCYIERTPPFRMAGRRFDQPGVGGTTGVQLHPDRLMLPLRWRKPRRVFVNSLADLFHDDVPDGFIAAMWFIMGQSAGCIPEQYRGHTFQILTKRPARMRAWMRKWADVGDPAIPPMDPAASRCGRAELIDAAQDVFNGKLSYDWMDGPRYWPTALPNVWLGVSVETLHWADIRIPLLLDTPAVVRWLSCEPLLGPVELWKHLYPDECPDGCGCRRPDDADAHECGCGGACCAAEWNPRSGIDWVVVGGESGPGARPMHPDWARFLRDQCVDADVAYFFKQWGQWAPDGDSPDLTNNHSMIWCRSKALAGRQLDGRTWDEYPEPG